MASEEIHITIEDDGTPTIEAKGVKGKSCTDLTKAIEEAFGGSKSTKLTREYHERAMQQARNTQGN